eukprot:Skav230642  [mRNA]  locus=scaffold1673:396012:397342:+ [translate_table: standard]
MDAQAQKQQALETLEASDEIAAGCGATVAVCHYSVGLGAKLEAETHEQLTALEAKNRPLSHQLVLLQQEDEAQARAKAEDGMDG